MRIAARMSIDTPFRGSLFANDFLCESIIGSPDWQAIDDSALDALKASVRDVFDGFPIAGSPNESQTEDDLIWPVLLQLGWKASLRQQNLSAQGREDVPDGLHTSATLRPWASSTSASRSWPIICSTECFLLTILTSLFQVQF